MTARDAGGLMGFLACCLATLLAGCMATANLRTNVMDFRGFESSIILILRGDIPRPIGNFPQSLSQAMLVGIMLVGRSGVHALQSAGHVEVHARLRTEVDHHLTCNSLHVLLLTVYCCILYVIEY